VSLSAEIGSPSEIDGRTGSIGRGNVIESMSEASSTRDRVMREYATDEIVVEWEPRLCYHSRNCVRSLPQVFDETRRPWVQVDAASADEVEAAVARCPSGALRTRRVGVAPARHTPLELHASENGPLLVSGGVRVVDADGNVLYEGEKAALCRCGGSSNKPFCDGTHKTNGFRG
jgi:uncharacterized Fe-S cluster protein YjdI